MSDEAPEPTDEAPEPTDEPPPGSSDGNEVTPSQSSTGKREGDEMSVEVETEGQ
jgi:hypothetical protein